MEQPNPPPASIPMPPGWEAKYNDQAHRYIFEHYVQQILLYFQSYFINHVNKTTQWEDPRLTHPFIWGASENANLNVLKKMFEDYPELIIRETLLKNSFDVNEAKNELMVLGGQKPKQKKSADHSSHLNSISSPTSTTPKKHQSPSQSPKPVGPKVDDFAFMSIKSKFPEVPNYIIQQVLTNFNQDEEKSCKELSTMGYSHHGSKKHSAIVDKFERIELEKEEKEKLLAKQRNEGFNQLKLEFSSFAEETVRQVLEKANFDMVDSRSTLRQLESKHKLAQLLDAATAEVARERACSAETKKSKQKSKQQQHEKSPTPPTAFVGGAASNEYERAISTSVTEIQQKSSNVFQLDKMILSNVSFKTDRQTTDDHPNVEHVKSIMAKGPDPTLRHGPNKDLLTKDLAKALGPDPTLRRGPCKEFYSGHNAALLLTQS